MMAKKLKDNGWVHRFNSEQDFLEYLKQNRTIQLLQQRIEQLEKQLKTYEARGR